MDISALQVEMDLRFTTSSTCILRSVHQGPATNQALFSNPSYETDEHAVGMPKQGQFTQSRRYARALNFLCLSLA